MTEIPDRRVGIVGSGAIGSQLARLLAADGRYSLTMLHRRATPRQDPDLPGIRFVATPAELLAASPQLVVEAASVEAFGSVVPSLLERGVDVIAASVGALAEPMHYEAVRDACTRGGSRLIVPAGAVGGLDLIAAAGLAADASVVYTSRKPPDAWRDELAARGIDLSTVKEEIVLFEGGAAEAARLYPRNLNAGLTVALAAGRATTTVRVVVDGRVSRNTHEIEIAAATGHASVRIENFPAPGNPKTSAITAYSVTACVHRYFSPIVV